MSNLWTGGVPPEALQLSKAFEGLRLKPYRDSAGVWTIGYGSTRALDGGPVTRSTPAITLDQANAMARRDLGHAAELAARAFPLGLPGCWGAVAVLTCNNMGDMRAWGATLHKLLLAGRWRQAAEQLKVYRNAGGLPSLGLRRRRWAEAAFTLGMSAEDAHERAWREIESPDDWPRLP
jgi:lysozyme